jgi:hypothetical protein
LLRNDEELLVIEIQLAWKIKNDALWIQFHSFSHGIYSLLHSYKDLCCCKVQIAWKIYGFFYSFGYTNTDIAPFGLVAQLFLFDLTHKLIDGPVVIFLHFVINSLMHGF